MSQRCSTCLGYGYTSAWCPNCKVLYGHGSDVSTSRDKLEWDELQQVQPDGHLACPLCNPDRDPDNLELKVCSLCGGSGTVRSPIAVTSL